MCNPATFDAGFCRPRYVFMNESCRTLLTGVPPYPMMMQASNGKTLFAQFKVFTMPGIGALPGEARSDMIARLKKIEGQARGIQKMVEDGRDCSAIIDQVASIKSAVNSLSGAILEVYAVHCLTNAAGAASPTQEIEEAVRVIVRAGR